MILKEESPLEAKQTRHDRLLTWVSRTPAKKDTTRHETGYGDRRNSVLDVPPSGWSLLRILRSSRSFGDPPRRQGSGAASPASIENGNRWDFYIPVGKHILPRLRMLQSTGSEGNPEVQDAEYRTNLSSHVILDVGSQQDLLNLSKTCQCQENDE